MSYMKKLMEDVFEVLDECESVDAGSISIIFGISIDMARDIIKLHDKM